MAKVTIEFDDNIQANAFAILSENGAVGTMINGYLDGINQSTENLDDLYASVTFDEDEYSVHHEVDFTA